MIAYHAPTSPGTPAVLAYPASTAKVITLANGLVLIIHVDHSAPVASVQAWVRTGSIHEGRHMGAGISHMLEHMLFKGTATRSGNRIAREVQDVGGYINAYTSFDRTVYWIDTPAKGVIVALDILTDAISHSTLPAEEFAKEQEVIRREFAMGDDDPDRVASHALFATTYREHPYQHPVIGHLDVFNAVTRDDVAAYYHARYVPNNMFLVVVGDVDAQAVEAQVRARCGGLARVAMTPVYLPVEPPQSGRREQHAVFETELTRLHIVWHVPDLSDPNIPALDVLAALMGQGRSSRLYRSLREEQGLVHSVSAWCYAPAHSGLWGVDAVLDPGHRKVVQAAILTHVEDLRRDGATAAELAKAKKQALAHQLQAVTTARGKASDLGANWLLTQNLDFSGDYLAAIQRVTLEDLQRVARTYLGPEALSIVSLNPGSSEEAALKIEDAPVAGEIRKFTLSNGLRLLVKEDARLPLVSAVATFKAGLLAEEPQRNGITRLLARTMLKGTGTRTGAEIADEIEAVGGSLSAEGGNNSLSVAVRVMQPDLRLGMTLLANVLTEANMPPAVIAREAEVQMASIKADDEEMTSVARKVLRSHLMPGHPYGLRALGTPESVAAITQEDLRAFYNRHVVAANGVLAVFGAVEAEAVRAMAEELFGRMPVGELQLTTPPRPAPLREARQIVEHRPKSQAVIMVGYLSGDMYSPDRAALELIDEACSDLGSRFFVRIREEMGLAYYVGTSAMPGLVPAPFVFYLGTDPQKVTAVHAEFLDEIRLLATHGLGEAELARAKEKLIGAQAIRHQSNDAFAFAVALDELYGLGFDHYLLAQREVEAVTLEDVQRVAAQYFGEQPALTVIVRPAQE